MPDRYLRDEETGTVWPDPFGHGDEYGVENRLRYGPNRDLFAASVASAYAALVDPHLTMDEAIKKLRHARRALTLCAVVSSMSESDEHIERL
jgi:hypothetical protein